MLLVALAFFPVYRPALQSIMLIAFSVFSIMFYYPNFKERINIKQNNISFLCITGYFIWALFSAVWSTNKSNLIKEIQPSLVLLLLPLVVIYFYPRITKKLRIIVFVGFIISNIILSLYLYHFIVLGTARWMAFYKADTFLYESSSLMDNLKYLKQITYKWSLAYGNFMEVSKRDYHKAYISSSFLISIALSLYLLFKTKSKLIIKVVLIVVILYFSIWVLYIKSIVNMLAYGSFFIFIILELKSKKNKLIVLTCIAISTISASVQFKETFINLVDDKTFFQEEYTAMSDEGYIIDYERTKIYNSAFKLLSNPKTILVGVGYPNCEIELNKQLKKYPAMSNASWNTHSEFLHFWISGGIINLLLLILLFVFIASKALKEKNTLLLYIMTIIFFNVIFENYMSRVMGAYMVAFFLCILPNNLIKSEFK